MNARIGAESASAVHSLKSWANRIEAETMPAVAIPSSRGIMLNAPAFQAPPAMQTAKPIRVSSALNVPGGMTARLGRAALAHPVASSTPLEAVDDDGGKSESNWACEGEVEGMARRRQQPAYQAQLDPRTACRRDPFEW